MDFPVLIGLWPFRSNELFFHKIFLIMKTRIYLDLFNKIRADPDPWFRFFSRKRAYSSIYHVWCAPAPQGFHYTLNRTY